MKLEELFKKGYYINLDRRTDRRALFEAEMIREGFPNLFERFVGHDGIAELDPGRAPRFLQRQSRLFEGRDGLVELTLADGQPAPTVIRAGARSSIASGQPVRIGPSRSCMCAETFRSSHTAASAPKVPNGSAISTVMGWTKELNCDASTM